MRRFVPLLLSLLVLTGCPQGSKSGALKSASATPKSSAKTQAAKTSAKPDELAKLPQVTYYAFKG